MVLKHYVEPSAGTSFYESRIGDVIITTLNVDGERILFGMTSDPPLPACMTIYNYQTHITNHKVVTMTTPVLSVGDVKIYNQGQQLVFENMTLSDSLLTIDKQLCIMSQNVNVAKRVTTQDMYIENDIFVCRAATIGESGSNTIGGILTGTKPDMYSNYFEIDPELDVNFDIDNMNVDLLVIKPSNPDITITVYGNVYMPDSYMFTKSLAANSNFDVEKDVLLERNVFVGTSMVANSVQIENSLLVDGATEFGNTTSIVGNVIISGDTNMSNFVLNIDYRTTFNKNLTVKNMNVSDVVFFNNDVTCYNIFTIENELYVNGDVKFANAYFRNLVFDGDSVSLDRAEVYGTLSIFSNVTSPIIITDFASVKPLDTYGRVIYPILVNGDLITNNSAFNNDVFAKRLVCMGDAMTNSLSTTSIVVENKSQFASILANFVLLRSNATSDTLTCNKSATIGNVDMATANIENCVFEQNLICDNFTSGDLKCISNVCVSNDVRAQNISSVATRADSGTTATVATADKCAVGSVLILGNFEAISASGVQISCNGLNAMDTIFGRMVSSGAASCVNVVVRENMTCGAFETKYLQSNSLDCKSMNVIGTSLLYGTLVLGSSYISGGLNVGALNSNTASCDDITTATCNAQDLSVGGLVVNGAASFGTAHIADINCMFVSQVDNVVAKKLNSSAASVDNLESKAATFESFTQVGGKTRCVNHGRASVGYAGNVQTSLSSVGYTTCTNNAFIASVACESMLVMGTSLVRCNMVSATLTSLGKLHVYDCLLDSVALVTNLTSLDLMLPSTNAANVSVADKLDVHGSVVFHDLSSLVPLQLIDDSVVFQSKGVFSQLTCLDNMDCNVTLKALNFNTNALNASGASIGMCTMANVGCVSCTLQGDVGLDTCTVVSATTSNDVRGNDVGSQSMVVSREVTNWGSTNVMGDVSCGGGATFGDVTCTSVGTFVNCGVTGNYNVENVATKSVGVSSTSVVKSIDIKNQIIAKNVGFNSSLQLSSLEVRGTGTMPRATFGKSIIASSGLVMPSLEFQRMEVYGSLKSGAFNVQGVNIADMVVKTNITAQYLTSDTMQCRSMSISTSLQCPIVASNDMTIGVSSVVNKTVQNKLTVYNTLSVKTINMDTFKGSATFTNTQSAFMMRVSGTGADLSMFPLYTNAVNMSSAVNASFKGNVTSNRPTLSGFATTGSYSDLAKVGVASSSFLVSGSYGHLTSCPNMALYLKKSDMSTKILKYTRDTNVLKSTADNLNFTVNSNKVNATLCLPSMGFSTSYASFATFASTNMSKYMSGIGVTFSGSFSSNNSIACGPLNMTYKPITIVSNKQNQFVFARNKSLLLKAKVAWNSVGQLSYTAVSTTQSTVADFKNVVSSNVCYVTSSGDVYAEEWQWEYPSNYPYVTASSAFSTTTSQVTIASNSVYVNRATSGNVTFTVYPGTTLMHSASSTLASSVAVQNYSWDFPLTTSVSYGVCYFAFGSAQRVQNIVNANAILISPYFFSMSQSVLNITSLAPYSRISFYNGPPSYYNYSYIVENMTNSTINTSVTPTTTIHSANVDKIYQCQPYVRFHSDTLCKGLWVDFYPIKNRIIQNGMLYIQQYEILSPVVEWGVKYVYAKLPSMVTVKALVLGPQSTVEVCNDTAQSWIKFSNSSVANIIIDLTAYGYGGTTNAVTQFKLYST